MTFTDIRDFFEKIKGRDIAFIGTGVSHDALIRRCARAGARVLLCDRRPAEKVDPERELRGLGVRLQTGENYLSGIEADMIFRTPGMYFYHPMLNEYRRRGVCVTSETELFLELCPCQVYAVTGSDGKTTTSNIIARLLTESGKTVHLGGNLGRALLPICEQISPQDVAVVELSSFQLISMRRSPDVAVITNIAPNHLDVHRNMQEYIDAKRNIYLHQNAFSRLVVNYDNEITRPMADEARGRAVFFSSGHPQAFSGENALYGSFLSPDGYLNLKTPDGETRLFHKSEIRIPGEHNVENYLTAVAAVGDEVSPDVMARVAREFGGVEHRIELCRTLHGVRYYNDSIASSPTRTIAGLRAMDHKVILIAGGYDKHIPYAPLAPVIKEKVALLITLGATADKIEAALREDSSPLPIPEICRVETLEQAVALAYSRARDGDIVLLSPASASFDQYRNFEERGRHFKALVNALH